MGALALEGILEALAGEVDPEWNIKVRHAALETDCLYLDRCYR